MVTAQAKSIMGHDSQPSGMCIDEVLLSYLKSITQVQSRLAHFGFQNNTTHIIVRIGTRKKMLRGDMND